MEMVGIVVVVALVLFSVTATTPPSSTVGGGGDAHSLPCIQKLMPCQPYLHVAAEGPKPPPTCCMPLKEIVEKDVTCLCSVFNNVDMLKSLNLTKENALVLPNACGAKADISQCKATSGSTTPSTTAPTTPPSSSTGSGSTGNSASSTAKSSDSVPAIKFVRLSLHQLLWQHYSSEFLYLYLFYEVGFKNVGNIFRPCSVMLSFHL